MPVVPENEPVLEAESEEKDPDKLVVDEFGRRWFRSEVYPRRYLLDTDSDGVVWWDEPGWGSRPCGHAATSFISWRALFWTCLSLCNDRCQGSEAFGIIVVSQFAHGNMEHYFVSYLFNAWVLPCGVRKIGSSWR